MKEQEKKIVYHSVHPFNGHQMALCLFRKLLIKLCYASLI